MANTIEEYVGERGIKWLLHFTRLGNLASILDRGLVTRDIIVGEASCAGVYNDAYRLDRTNAVCASISFPNYKMFWGLRRDHGDVEWVIVVIHPAALWLLKCAFCQTNAASSSVTAIPLVQRSTLAALQRMFDDFGDTPRARLGLPPNYPTNPQAEVLLLDGVPRDFILGVYVQTEAMKEKVKLAHPDLTVVVNTTYFSYRRDYEHWR